MNALDMISAVRELFALGVLISPITDIFRQPIE
jgi:hypothetical protein